MNYIAHHFCIKVTNIEKSKEFYIKALRFHEYKTVMHTPNVTSCFLKSEHEEFQIQLLHITDYKPNQQQYGHFGVKVEDIHSAYTFHESLGCISQDIVTQPHQIGYFIKDPDGYETEICQLLEERK